MITLTVLFFSQVRGRVGKESVQFTTGKVVLGEALEEILSLYKVRDLILSDNGNVRPWASVLVNGRMHEFVGGLEAKLKDGDRVALVYPFIESL